MSEAQILKPFGEYLTPGPNAEVVDLLREALAAAERGEVLAVGIAMVNQSGFTMTRATKGSRGMGEIVGAAAVMQDDLIRMWKSDV